MGLLYVNVHLLGAERRQGLNHLSLPPLGGNKAGRRYSGPAALKSGLIGCTPMLWRLTSRCASMEAALAARADSSELADLAGLA
jgi:hypothetical protein